MSAGSVIALRGGSNEATPAAAAGCVVMAAIAVSSHLHLVSAMIRDGHPGAEIDDVQPSALPGVDLLHARLRALDGEEPGATTWASARRLADRLEGHAVVGLSSFRADPTEIDEARREAELVLAVLMRHDDPTPEDVNSGTYRLLFRTMASSPRVLHDFCETTIGALKRYDERRRGDLVRTLRTYLGEANCSLNATAAATFTHRHTVAYRLERTKELTGLDPGRPADREQLGLGLKVALILDAASAPNAPAESRLSRECRVAAQTARRTA